MSRLSPIDNAMTRETTEERTRERWKRALDLFEQALPLPPTEREQFLESVGREDPTLRQNLNDLLIAHRETESLGFLESPSWVYQPPESNPPAMIGRSIGAYRLTQYLAKGGMGVVYLAERADRFFRRQVAIKFINAETGARHYQRFRREVQILADLKHPNLVLLYDAGRLGDGRPYLVMEYVEGENLRDWPKRRGAISPELVVEIIKQAAAGLHAAHEAGVIHRDIKPANIVVSETGGKLTVKVLDFGVAARKQHDGVSVSSTQGAIGTLLYMSPEQLQLTKGVDLTPASDVYALGLTAYELLTGRPANDGKSQAEIISKHLYETPPPPSQAAPAKVGLTGFDRVVMKALAKEPGARYQSTIEFADELATSLSNADQPTHRVEPPPIPTPAPRQVNDAAKHWHLKHVLIAAALLGGVSSAYFLLGSSSPVYFLPQNQTMPEPTVAPTVVPKKLRLLAEVIDIYGQPLPGSAIAIFNTGVITPEKITEHNAVVLRTKAPGLGGPTFAEISEGVHLIKTVRTGYKTRYDNVKFDEDRTNPGSVSLKIVLEPE